MRSTCLLVTLASLACSGAPPVVSAPTAPPRDTSTHASAVTTPEATPGCDGRHGGMSIEGGLGTLPPARVRAALNGAQTRLTACFTQRLEAVPCLAGRVGFKIRVGTDGAVRWALANDTTLGDRDTERCMQQALGALDFGRPCGGEAEVTWSMEFDGGPDVRPATTWAPARLDLLLRQRRAALTACRNGSSAALAVTLYAAPNSTVAAAGASVPNPEAEAVVDCVVREVRGWRTPSPGSWYARATVNIP